MSFFSMLEDEERKRQDQQRLATVVKTQSINQRKENQTSQLHQMVRFQFDALLLA